MSPRAASRFESLGFTRVYDYVAGKADWGSFGLPLEGRRPGSTRVGAHVRSDVPACGPADRMAGVRERVRDAAWDTCFVTNAERRLTFRRLRFNHPASDAARYRRRVRRLRRIVCRQVDGEADRNRRLLHCNPIYTGRKLALAQ